MASSAAPGKDLSLGFVFAAALLASVILALLPGCAGEPTKKPAPTPQKQAIPRVDGAPAQSHPTSAIAFRPIRNIGILLPRTGQFLAAATALRDGLLAAYYSASPAGRPGLTFYDSSNPGDAPRLYREAIANGADLVLGPLQKEGVDALLSVRELPVPVLALNRVEGNIAPPENLYMYGLSPEDEAAEVADRARADGREVALVLSPHDNWGERLQKSFTERWSALGGTVAETQTYNPNDHEFTDAIQQLLRLKQSQERHTRLQTTLGRKIDFEPRRRQDADFIFLIAQNQKAREIWPQLQFSRAADLAVYSTSSIYSGSFDRRSDLDLVGLYFPDLPWLLRDDPQDPLSRSALATSIPEVGGTYARLYAMGIDSYELAVRLEQLVRQPTTTLNGRTGTLYLDPLHRIHRRLIWAQMSDSGPVIVAASPTRPPSRSASASDSPAQTAAMGTSGGAAIAR